MTRGSAAAADGADRVICFLGEDDVHQMGIAAYLRNLAVRCNQIARSCGDVQVNEALAAISAELADKAEVLEETFRLPARKR